MNTFWIIIAVLAAIAAGWALAQLIRIEYRLYRSQKLRERLQWESEVDWAASAGERIQWEYPRTSSLIARRDGTDYSAFDQDALLRNRSERAQDW